MRGNDFKVNHVYAIPGSEFIENSIVIEFGEKYNRGNFKLLITQKDLDVLKQLMDEVTSPPLPEKSQWDLYLSEDESRLDKLGEFKNESKQ